MCSGGAIASQAELLLKYKLDAERNDSDELTDSMRSSIVSSHHNSSDQKKPLLIQDPASHPNLRNPLENILSEVPSSAPYTQVINHSTSKHDEYDLKKSTRFD